jgi:Ca2+-binding EF-hand superfamily protein
VDRNSVTDCPSLSGCGLPDAALSAVAQVTSFLTALGDSFKPIDFAQFKDLVQGKGELGEQFAGLTSAVSDLQEEQGLRKLFDSIDTDHGGTIDKAELTFALKNLGKQQSEITKLIAELGDEFVPLDFIGFKNLIVGKRGARRKASSLVRMSDYGCS